MDLSTAITHTFNKYIEVNFLKHISTKYNISAKDLMNDWKACQSNPLTWHLSNSSGNSSGNNQVSDTSGSDSMADSMADSMDKSESSNAQTLDKEQYDKTLMGMSVPELKAICKSKGMKVSGKRQELLDRILASQNASADVSKVEKKPKKKSPKKRSPPVPISSITIKKNQFGNYEHPETHLVLSKERQVVIGKQNDNGTIDQLTADDIKLCDQFKFNYDLPETLNKPEEMKTLGKESNIIETLDEIIGSEEEDFDEFFEEDD